MKHSHGYRVLLSCLSLIGIAIIFATAEPWDKSAPTLQEQAPAIKEEQGTALAVLEQLPVKGRAPKTGYARTQFGNGWQRLQGCDMRNIILARDLIDIKKNNKCQVISGTLVDPYSGTTLHFMRGQMSSQDVQIDHIVALSNAWQTGARQLSESQRIAFANDPLNLLAVDGTVNQKKGDGDAATWLPPNKPFRCDYVARQIAVKHSYGLWVTQAEKDAIRSVLKDCVSQQLPVLD